MRPRRTAALGLAALLVVAALAWPCGPYLYSALFWPPVYDPGGALVGGAASPRAGLLLPGQSVSELLADWRLLRGLGLPEELRAALARPAGGAGPYQDLPGAEAWAAARAAYGPVPETDPWRPVGEMQPVPDSWQVYLSCPDDAWATAARTLREREARYGERSPEVRRWVAAQDRVFAACAGPAPLPEPADASWDALARADRAYQLAAARFYNRDFAGAAAGFASIADDPASPWRHLAPYLVARAWIRDATVGGCPAEECLQRAAMRLRQVAATSPDPAVRRAAAGALGYALARLEPEARRRELAELLTAEPLPEDPGLPTLAQAAVDYDRLLHRTGERNGPSFDAGDDSPQGASDEGDAAAREARLVTSASRGGDAVPATETAIDGTGDPFAGEEVVTRWVRLLHHPRPAGAAEAAARWRQTRALPWLAAAMALGPAAGDSGDDLLAAAAVGEGSPAWSSLTFHRARWLAGRGERDAARDLLDELLAGEGDGSAGTNAEAAAAGSLSPGDRNRVLDLRAAMAADLDDLTRHAVLTPVAVGFDVGFITGLMSEDGERPEPWLGPSALALIDRTLPLDRWAELAGDARLPSAVRRQLAAIGWTRAVLTGREAAARRLGGAAVALAPALAGDLAAWAAAEAPEARRFAAVWLLLHQPGLRPGLRPAPGRHEPLAEIDAYRDNWWCAGGTASGLSLAAEEPPQAPWPEAELRRATEERGRLTELPAAPVGLGETVLAWARAHPQDPRVPEALHLAVRATRHGCPQTAYGEVSRAAFTLLHRRYPASPWTARTPYWFD